MNNEIREIFSEVYAILNTLGKEYIDKIPDKIYNLIKENKSNEYNPIYVLDERLKN